MAKPKPPKKTKSFDQSPVPASKPVKTGDSASTSAAEQAEEQKKTIPFWTHDPMKKCTIVHVGGTKVGKSQLMRRKLSYYLKEGKVQDVSSMSYNETVGGTSYRDTEFKPHDSEAILKSRVAYTDTSGNKKYKNSRDKAIRDADAIILCYDCSNRASLFEVEGLLDELIEVRTEFQAKTTEEFDISIFPIFIVGLKSDISPLEDYSEKCGQIASKYGINSDRAFYKASSVTGNGIDNLYLDVLRAIYSKNKSHVESLFEFCQRFVMRNALLLSTGYLGGLPLPIHRQLWKKFEEEGILIDSTIPLFYEHGLSELKLDKLPVDGSCIISAHRYCNSITSLSVKNCRKITLDSVLYALENIDTLTELDMTDCGDFDVRQILENLKKVGVWSRLTKLSIGNRDRGKEKETIPGDCDFKILTQQMEETWDKTPRIEELSLHYCDSLMGPNGEGFDLLSLPVFSSMKEIRLNSCGNVTASSLLNMAKNMPKVVSITVSECPDKFGDKEFNTVFINAIKHCYLLRSLTVHNWHNVTDKCMDEFQDHWKSMCPADDQPQFMAMCVRVGF